MGARELGAEVQMRQLFCLSSPREKGCSKLQLFFTLLQVSVLHAGMVIKILKFALGQQLSGRMLASHVQGLGFCSQH